MMVGMIRKAAYFYLYAETFTVWTFRALLLDKHVSWNFPRLWLVDAG